jgi:hypothetical protein
MTRLSLEARLEDLSLHHCVMDEDCLGDVIYQAFEDNPLLPGVVLVSEGGFYGMVSRRRFLESMSRAYGREL